MNKSNPIPTEHKINLTISEAAEYSNIGINRIEQMLKSPDCPFLLCVGSKRLVKRKKFEEFMEECTLIE